MSHLCPERVVKTSSIIGKICIGLILKLIWSESILRLDFILAILGRVAGKIRNDWCSANLYGKVTFKIPNIDYQNALK